MTSPRSVFSGDQACQRCQAAGAAQHSHEARDSVTYRPGGEKDAEAETDYSPAEPPHAVRLRVRLVSGNPVFPRRPSHLRWRVRISLRGSLNVAKLHLSGKGLFWLEEVLPRPLWIPTKAGR